MNKTVLKLKENVDIEPFDTSSQENTFLVTYNNRSWQVAEIVYRISFYLTGNNSIETIVDKINETNRTETSIEFVSNVIDTFFIKRGLIEGTDDDSVRSKEGLNKYLWFKKPIINSTIVYRFRMLSVLYNKKIVISILVSGILIQLYAYIKNISFANFVNLMRLRTGNIVYIFILVIFSMIIHEFGHMSALMKYKIRPGNIGFGIYLTTPVLYADVSLAWKLKRKERVVVDVGGTYFEFIYFTLLCIIGIISGNSVFILSGFTGQISIYRTFNPFLKLDGYWVLSDFLGIPNLHKKAQELLTSCIYKVFRIEAHSRFQINKREYAALKIYTIAVAVFVAVFSAGIGTFLFKSIKKMPQLFNVSLLYEYFVQKEYKLLLANLSDSLGGLIIILIIIKIISIAIKSIKKTYQTIVKEIKTMKKL